jgi:hypothetical protein
VTYLATYLQHMHTLPCAPAQMMEKLLKANKELQRWASAAALVQALINMARSSTDVAMWHDELRTIQAHLQC